MLWVRIDWSGSDIRYEQFYARNGDSDLTSLLDKLLVHLAVHGFFGNVHPAWPVVCSA